MTISELNNADCWCQNVFHFRGIVDQGTLSYGWLLGRRPTNCIAVFQCSVAVLQCCSSVTDLGCWCSLPPFHHQKLPRIPQPAFRNARANTPRGLTQFDQHLLPARKMIQGVFLTGPPHFQYRKEKWLLANQSCCSMKFFI